MPFSARATRQSTPHGRFRQGWLADATIHLPAIDFVTLTYRLRPGAALSQDGWQASALQAWDGYCRNAPCPSKAQPGAVQNWQK